MKKTMTLVLTLALAAGFYISVSAATDEGGLESLRGTTPLAGRDRAPEAKQMQAGGKPMPRSYLQQPPLIPHSIEGFEITTGNNMCLGCHGPANYQATGAAKISATHFTDRDAKKLKDVASRRYFCTQCHVPQVDARPLVENTFKPVNAVSPKKK